MNDAADNRNVLKLSALICILGLGHCQMSLPQARSAASPSFSLVDAANSVGLNFRQNNFATSEKYPFETLGGAVAVLDYNNDGSQDLCS